jgi:hypothetical protein
MAMIALALGAFAKNLFEIFLSFHGIGQHVVSFAQVSKFLLENNHIN